jgi:hypothetical protein
MNERIAELAGQALNEYSATYHNEAKIPEAYLKKFAELIVRECIDVVGQASASPNGYQALMKHFGIEP